MLRIIFMGTPDFAVPSLLTLAEDHHVVAVVTQPDAPARRGRELLQSAVKQAALGLGLPVMQPPSLKQPEVIAELGALRPDIIIVAAFGQILRRAVLELPPLGCLNAHASLLPRWRGASPVPAAIAAGDAETGVTLMKMDPGLDTGPIIAQRHEPIHADDTTATLLARLAGLGASLAREMLPAWARGELSAVAQDPGLVTTCGLIKKEDGRMDWARPAAALERHVRSMTPWPGASTSWAGKQMRILRARVSSSAVDAPAGTVVAMGSGFGVACGQGGLEIIEAQLEGRRPMSAADLARGQRGLVGARLD
ncbi:MAG: methionyl-tRNA formyltransferase [Thermoflexales bacterium]